MESKKYIVTWIASGQPRAYADSRYIAELQYFVGDKPATLDRSALGPIMKALVHHFEDDGKGDWSSARLKSLSLLSPGKWRVEIVQPYLD